MIVQGVEPSVLNPIGVLTNYLNLNLPAGLSYQVIWTIPLGQRYKMTMFSITYVGTVAGVTLRPRVSDGTNILLLQLQAGIVSAQTYVYITDLVLEAGWTLDCEIVGATLNDDFSGRVGSQRIK